MNKRSSRIHGRTLAAATAAMLAFGMGPALGGTAKATAPRDASDIAEQLRQTIDQLHFEQVLDTAPVGSAQARALKAIRDKEGGKGGTEGAAVSARSRAAISPADAKPIVQQPQVDASVIELDEDGRPVSSGTVLMSPQYQHGVIVPVDRNFHTDQVRWREWEDDNWYLKHGQGSIDVVPGREHAPLDFMTLYPASVLKLMSAFGVLQLVDQHQISLDDTYDYNPATVSSLCGGPVKRTIREFMDMSLTVSSNGASCALIKLLHDHKMLDGPGELNTLNRTFADLGLETLQLNKTNPVNGGGWNNPVHMTSLDTAKLLALVNGVPGKAWTGPDGKPVTSAVLSPRSRRLFKKMLGNQAWQEGPLSTTNWCGRQYPAAGIPQVTPKRWIADDGTAVVNEEVIVNKQTDPTKPPIWGPEIDTSKFGQQIEPCDQSAEVTFAHKTGLFDNAAGDAGIVKALPGEGGRTYIIVVFSNLGNQYLDPIRPADPPGIQPVRYTEKFAKLGLAIDQYEAQSSGDERSAKK